MGNYSFSGTELDDKKYFQSIFVEYYAPLLGFSNKFISNKTEAEDIVQEVFVNLWENRSKYYNVESISSYLYMSVRNKAYNHIRDNKNITKTDYDNLGLLDKNVEELIIEDESVRLILKELESLPSRCKDIFHLSLLGLKSRDIAEELNIAIETVKKQKQRAKKLLKEKVTKLLSLFLIFS
jgi:RNA polymerase sigma-70 factor (ECF subfamily)